MIFEGDLLSRLRGVISRGIFYLMSDSSAQAGALGVIRGVYLDAHGNTVLKGESRELRNSVKFRTGQRVKVLLPYPYGNIRDSDSDLSVYRFSSGEWSGQRYPLWNWSIIFTNFPILSYF